MKDVYAMAGQAEPPEELDSRLKQAARKPWFPITPVATLAGLPVQEIFRIGSAIWRNELSFDPAPSTSSLSCGLLVILGSDDHSVGPTSRMLEALGSAFEGSPRELALRIFPGADHDLIISDGTVGEDQYTYATGLFQTVSWWISGQTAQSPSRD